VRQHFHFPLPSPFLFFDSHWLRGYRSKWSTVSGDAFYLLIFGMSSAMDPTEIRARIGKFRALVIGRPNAGKTTILRCIARSADGRVSVFFSLKSRVQ